MSALHERVPAPRWFTAGHVRLRGGKHPCAGGDDALHRARLARLVDDGVTTV